MKKIWERLSILARYYITSMLSFFIFWGILVLLGIDYLDTLFFVLAFIWHFTLLTPGLKEKMLTSKHRFSFLNVVVRINYYLQLFIKIQKVPFGTSVVRALSPLIFTFFLMVLGGSGNLLFTILGSVCFEVSYYFLNKKSISTQPKDPEMPPEIPNAESSHE